MAIPTMGDPNNSMKSDVVSSDDYLLYHGGTIAKDGNSFALVPMAKLVAGPGLGDCRALYARR